MKVVSTRKINERIMQLVESRQINVSLMIKLSMPIATEEIVFEDPALIKKVADELQKNAGSEEYALSYDEYVMGAMVCTILNDKSGAGAVPDMIIDQIVKNSHIYHEGELEDDPYYKNIRFEDQKSGEYGLTYKTFKPYELFHYYTPVIFEDIMIPAIGTFDHEFRYPCIFQKDKVWVSITPNEITTMQKPIKDAQGKVLTLGCGMGYYSYMVSEKDDVESVTIIERSEDVIKLFETYILPQFPHKDKIHIVQADAYEYINELKDGEYDYCFAELWYSNMDIGPYLRLKDKCKRFKTMKISYWIEDGIIATIMGYIYVSILGAFYYNQGIKRPDIGAMGEEEAEKNRLIDKLLEKEEITKPEHVDYYMDPKNIIKLLEGTSI